MNHLPMRRLNVTTKLRVLNAIINVLLGEDYLSVPIAESVSDNKFKALCRLVHDHELMHYWDIDTQCLFIASPDFVYQYNRNGGMWIYE